MAEDNRTGIAAGLAVGLASAAVLGVGVLFLYLLFRKDQGYGPLALAAPQPITLNLAGLGYPQVPQPAYLPEGAQPTTAVAPRMLGSGPTMSTVTVPKASPVFVGAASSTPVRLTVRPVSPVAGFVVLAYSASALQGDTYQSGGFIVPVGKEQTVRLLPKQQLYARAITPPAETCAYVSVARAEDSF